MKNQVVHKCEAVGCNIEAENEPDNLNVLNGIIISKFKAKGINNVDKVQGNICLCSKHRSVIS